ncbi:MAG: DUF5615 family PIN-like protein [Chloroflexota bacterium]|nr:DUF5615 family PIN-like protein [Chloroflexota bacterium]
MSRGASRLLRAAGHDAVTAHDLRLSDATDDLHLLTAAQQGRIFVTHNENHFVLLHDAWLRWTAAWGISADHAGVVVVPQGTRYGVDWDAAHIAEELLACLQYCTPLTNGLFRRKAAGWERRQGRDWIPSRQ